MFQLSFSKKLFIGLSFALALLITLSIVSLSTIRKLQTADNWVNHTYEVISLTNHISENFQDAQTNQILYVITGNKGNLRAFNIDRAAVSKQINAIKILVNDNPAQLRRVEQLNNCLTGRINDLSRINQNRLDGGYQPTQVVTDANGLNASYTCEDAIAQDIVNAEKILLRTRKAASSDQARQTIEIILASCLGSLFLLSAMFWLVKNTFRQRRLLTEQLKLSEGKFSKAFNDSASGMALVSADGLWIDINNFLLELLGYSKEELLNTHVLAITHPDDIGANLELLNQVALGEVSKYRIEKRFMHKDGYPIWVLVNVSLVNDLTGVEPFYVSQVIDISATKKMIAQMEMKNNVLTNTSSDLNIKIKQLEDFNNIVAHNLRGPAATIQYILNMMIEEESEEEKQDYLNMLVDTSKALNETLADLMYILEIKLNDKIHFDNCVLNEIIEKTSLALTGEILQAKATIKTNFGVDRVNFPRVYMESIFYNMISNSLKYRKKDIPVEVTISSFSDAGKTNIVFEDNGLGIDLKRHGADIFKLNKVFHAGFDSKGVGLFITKNQLETHGGNIQVESRPNRGSKFTISLN